MQSTLSTQTSDLTNPDTIIMELKQMEACYETFTCAMMTCFTTAEAKEEKFLTLRNQVVTDALTYHQYVVPVVQKTLARAREFFKNFEDAYDTEDDFIADLPYLISDTAEIVCGLGYVSELHSGVVAEANKRKIEAEKAIVALGALSNEYEEAISKSKKNWIKLSKEVEILGHPGFFALDLIPIAGGVAHIGMLIAVLYKNSKIEDLVHSINITQSQQDVIGHAVIAIEQALVPALSAYLEVVEKLQRIFKALHLETEAILGLEGQMAEQQQRARFFFNKIKKRASQVAQVSMSLLTFYEVANSRLLAMRESSGSTVNWVEIWDSMYEKNKASGLLKRLKDVVFPKDQLKNLKLPSIEESD